MLSVLFVSSSYIASIEAFLGHTRSTHFDWYITLPVDFNTTCTIYLRFFFIILGWSDTMTRVDSSQFLFHFVPQVKPYINSWKYFLKEWKFIPFIYTFTLYIKFILLGIISKNLRREKVLKVKSRNRVSL